MPWEDLEYPSIQLGILLSTLEQAGIPAQSASLKLDFLEHCSRATASLPEKQRLSVRSYREVVEWSRDVSVGDWIFSTAGARSPGPDADEAYLDFLRGSNVPDSVIGAAREYRRHVPSFLESAAEQIAAAQPGVVGFSTAFNQTLSSLALAQEIRARLGDEVRIVFGGANCGGPMGAALHRAFPVVDIVVRGEGENILPELARDLLASRAIRPRPGLCYRDPDDGHQIVIEEAAGSVNLDELPTPRYEEYFERLDRTSFADELLPDLTLFYESARGCWWGEKSHCSFCGISDLVMPFRAKSPDRVVSELLELAQRYRSLQFLFVDYILSRAYFKEVLPRLRDTGYDFRIFCETKANLREDDVRLLHDAGFTLIQAGVESLSTPILKLMRKGVTALQNLRLLKWCAQYGVRLHWNVLYGIPGEPVEEYSRMAHLIPSLTHLDPPRIVPLELDRFSPYFEHPADFGIVPLRPRRDFRFVFPEDSVDDATLADIAYAFEFVHADGRDPEMYTAPVRQAIRAWQAHGRTAIGTLRYRRGPGFLIITDRRPGLEPAEYHLREDEARIYLACEDGATAEVATRIATNGSASDLATSEVEAFLDELVEARVACKVDERYLALALPPAASTPSVRGLEAPETREQSDAGPVLVISASLA